MAKASSSISPAAWASWSPGHLASSTKIPRRYVQVPSDQQRLLHRADAWSVGRFPNVPPRVLEDVKARYVKDSLPRSELEREALSSQPASPVSVERGEAFSSQPASPTRSAGAHTKSNKTSVGAEDDSDGETDTSGTQISWTPSPSAHVRGPCPREVELATAASIPNRRSSEQHGPGTVGKALHRATFLTEFPPSSSAASEPGLEVEVPKAITDVLEPVSRPVVALEPAPPSAQIIPCTLTTEKTSPARATQRAPAPANQPGVVATSQRASDQGSSNSTDKLPPNGPPSQVPYTAFQCAYPDYKGSLRDFICSVLSILPLQKERALPEFLYDDFVRVFSTDFLKYISTVDNSTRPLPAIQFYNEKVSRPLYTQGILTKNNIKDVANQYPEKTRSIQQGLEKTKSEAPRRPARQASHTATADKQMAQPRPIGTETTNALPEKGLPRAASFASPGLGAQAPEMPVDPVHAIRGPRAIQGPRGTAAPLAASINVSGPSAARQPHTKTSRPTSVAGTPATRPAVLRTQVDSSLPDMEPSTTRIVAATKLAGASTFSGTAPSQVSNPDSIPETTLKKRRAAPRASSRSSAGEPGAKFKKHKKGGTPAERALRYKEWLEKQKPQSSTPL
ncbi:hypothetical protein C8A01DRAFT_16209 [Parachaetomium inaequale]|uniref:Uncharacterized protein n=1 Tax=Parachaetomium inaequale TaxID=2588326 RepID=A0AAN6PIY3_9PEZI|nr:hypothetical protein C8A01DRAFT_16209 [Parachaetomium inaequale]